MTEQSGSGRSGRPPLTVVIATRDRADQLRCCLETLTPELGPDDEVIVVDSASRDDRTRDVAIAAGVRVLRADRPGTSVARNLGWQAAGTDLVAFTDDDVEVDVGWPDAMVRALSAPGGHWVTGWIGVRKRQPGAQEFNPTMLETAGVTLDRHRRKSMGASANFGTRRAMLAEVGGFDERFGPGTWTAAAEDVELFDRLIDAGYDGRYEPAVRVFHEQWRTKRDAVTLNWRYGKGMGARLALLTRRRPRQAASIGNEVVWGNGLVPTFRNLRAGYELGALLAALRVLGTVVGYLAWMFRR